MVSGVRTDSAADPTPSAALTQIATDAQTQLSAWPAWYKIRVSLEDRFARQAHNESLFREVNERIAKLGKNAQAWSPDGTVEFLCECGEQDGCGQRVRVPVDVYERVRSQDDRFVVRPGHETRSSKGPSSGLTITSSSTRSRPRSRMSRTTRAAPALTRQSRFTLPTRLTFRGPMRSIAVLVDRCRHEFDVAELLRRDARDQVEERTGALARAEVEGLKGVVQPGRHLTELPAEQLLHCCGAGGIRVGRRRQGDPVTAKNHDAPWGRTITFCASAAIDR